MPICVYIDMYLSLAVVAPTCLETEASTTILTQRLVPQLPQKISGTLNLHTRLPSGRLPLTMPRQIRQPSFRKHAPFPSPHGR